MRPQSDRYRSAMGAALENVASTLHLLSREKEARTAYRQAIDDQTRALEARPDNVNYRRFLAHHYWGLAEVERSLGDVNATAEAEARAKELDAKTQ